MITIDPEKLFSEQLENALSDDSVVQRAKKERIDTDYLWERIKERKEILLGAASEQFNELNKLIDAEQGLRKWAQDSTPVTPIGLIVLERTGASAKLILGFLGFAAVVILIGWDFGMLKSTFLTYYGLFFIPVLIVLSILGASASIWTVSHRHREYDRLLEERGLKSVTTSQEHARESLNRNLREIINQEINAIIESRREPSYSLMAKDVRPIGLTDDSDLGLFIQTEAMDELVHMFETTRGGSIGIAGPRGAGKTTIIRSICENPNQKIRGRLALRILTSAPIQYNARDFFLHLFSLACARVWKFYEKDPRHILEVQESQLAAGSRVAKPILTNLRRFRLLILAAGLIGMLMFMMGTVLYTPTNEQVINSKVPDDFIGPLPPDSGTPASGIVTTLMGEVLGDGVTLLRWGGIVMFVSFGLLSVMILQSRSRRWEVYKSPSPTPQGKLALKWLRRIQFQQSYTTGWSGALKMPLGVEAGVKAAEELAQRQLNLPEIVEAYKRFLEEVALKNMVVIGIDELDKMESDEKAQRFLNDIKAIFWQKNCYYLLSVSESALSNFDRRGLKVRDAFDSSFDNIIHVEYLDLEASQRVLVRRASNLSMPFVCLCYVLSGGLARDLVRIHREMLKQISSLGQSVHLRDVSVPLIKADLDAKIKAQATALGTALSHHLGREYAARLRRFEAALDKSDNVKEAYYATRCNFNMPSQREMESDTFNEIKTKVEDLWLELQCYALISDTAMQLFTDKSEDFFKDSNNLSELNTIALARQVAGPTPKYAIELLEDVREGLGLEAWEPKARLHNPQNNDETTADG